MPLATREAQREYQRRWIAKRRLEWIMRHGPCVDCGTWDDLEIDHVDPKLKQVKASNLWSYREEIREVELAKCCVRCDRCHQKKTNRDRDRGFTIHGSYQRGYKRGCKCAECRRANAERSARGRKARAG